jgi:hypothetical protein
MVTSKIVRLLGTTGINRSNKILVYNSATFTKSRIVGLLGMGEDEAKFLTLNPEPDTIDNIYEILIRHNEFLVMEDQGSGHYLFNNDNYNCISGEGFDTMIFLSDDEIIGYIVLLEAQGVSKLTTEYPYTIKRTYTVKNINIYINSEDGSVRVDQDTIRLLDNIPEDLTTIPGFITKSDIGDYDTVKNGNYSYHVNNLLKSSRTKETITDTTFAKITGDTYKLLKLDLERNIILGSEYSDFKHEQIGYYKGDPCLYVWNDNCEYSIFSLTITLDKLFGLNSRTPKPYTYPRRDQRSNMISATNIYKIPVLEENEDMSIDYFAGHYAVVKVGDLRYLFDIDLQESGDVVGKDNKGWVADSLEDTGNIISYIYQDGEWIPSGFTAEKTIKDLSLYLNPTEGVVIGCKEYEKILTNRFILDTLDPYNMPFKFSMDEWQNQNEAIKDYCGLSDTYSDIEWVILSDSVPIKKIGEWIVFENEDESTLTYRNMTKTVKFRIDEEPIVINDNVLLGRNDNTYTLYNNSGYYVSKLASNLTTLNNKTEFNRTYKLSPRTFTGTVPIEITGSFLNNFRRNVLPETLEDFKIIGALSGIIYYRIGNMINYL